VGLTRNSIYQGDCIGLLKRIEPGTIDLVFADPPFNIGYEYDVYRDEQADDEYLRWTREWMLGVHRALKPNGAFWLAIGDEYAAELKLIAKNDVGFTCRSWVIWYYTFGVNCTRMFSRSHTHLLYFVKNPRDFTFNADDPAIRVPSARQLVYADARANPDGRLPDNTWMLRPQDISDGFKADHDTWYFPRVAGTFKERQGFHGCQMPEQILGRIIRCCSNPADIVLDPFGGSGTTLAVAKKLGRQWIGFELSKDYVSKIKSRLDATRPGAPLDGAANPLTSAPPTVASPIAARNASSPVRKKKGNYLVGPRRSLEQPGGFADGIVDAYRTTHDGFAVDRMLADVALNGSFLDACRRKGLPGNPVEWNRALLRIRKAGRLPHIPHRVRAFTYSEMDLYSFASEIALQQLSVECDATLDDILCDPKLAARFDKLAATFSPGYTSFQYRWAALALRKRARRSKKIARELHEWLNRRLPPRRDFARCDWSEYACPGVYLLSAPDNRWLYVGETLNLQRRVNLTGEIPAWRKEQPLRVTLIRDDGKPFGLQSILIGRVRPVMNSHLLLPDIEAVTCGK
jgi:DNA modification methylase